MKRQVGRLGGLAFAVSLVLVGGLATPAVSLADQPTFGTPTAIATLGQPLTFTDTINGSDIASVDVVVKLVGYDPMIVLAAQPTGNPGEWQASADVDVASSIECTCYATGPSAPNTSVTYQFRVHASDGTITAGPQGQATVTDPNFTWQTLTDRMVTVHWYQGDQAFAQAAANVANDAIDKASQLLGVTLPKPVDLYIYATQQALINAVSPARDAIAGEAHATIGTMYVWLPPSQSASDQAVTIAHELTHLVFNQAIMNPYHEPPRWLNEGIAVYLSEGYSGQWQAEVSSAVAANRLIPLDGLAGLFPSPTDEFYLAYGESVSAVNYFIQTYGDQKLWTLVDSYSQGLSDDDAFTQAIGINVETFNQQWMTSLGVSVPPSFGPQPGQPGPVPSAWTAQPSVAPGSAVPGSQGPATPAPGSSNVAVIPGPTPGATANPSAPAPGGGGVADYGAALLIVFVIVLLAAVGIGAWLVLRPRPPQPPQPPWY
jgi:hypothetical protein